MSYSTPALSSVGSFQKRESREKMSLFLAVGCARAALMGSNNLLHSQHLHGHFSARNLRMGLQSQLIGVRIPVSDWIKRVSRKTSPGGSSGPGLVQGVLTQGRGWNERNFKVSSNPTHSVVL